MANLQATLQQRLASIHAANRYRERQVVDGVHAVICTVNGKRCINFCSNDYLGIAADPMLSAALRAASAIEGVGSGASQLISGYNSAHRELENELADWLGRERALLFSSGFLANQGAITALLGKADVAFCDALNHASLIDGVRLSGADKHIYPHADMAALEAQLQASVSIGQRMIISDGVFSMDGDSAPLPALARLARQHDAWLMIDDAHALGVMGPQGAGSVAAAALTQEDVPVLVGTLGKALGSMGAFVAGSAALIDYLVNTARSVIFTTAPPPALAEATRKALQIARHESWRRERLADNIGYFRQRAASLGLPLLDSHTPIQPVVLGSEATALAASAALWQRGYRVGAIRPPTVPEGSSRLRITLSATHDPRQIDGLLEALAKLHQPTAAA